jgi:DNA integrity scanning protein DisA with diadenylate cyclase activity
VAGHQQAKITSGNRKYFISTGLALRPSIFGDFVDSLIIIKELLTWRAIADILLITAGLFFLYRTLLRLGTWAILTGILLATAVFFVANFLDLKGIEWIYSNLSHVALIALIMSIFDPNSPGHDGALVVQNGLFAQFGVRLPISESQRLTEAFGTRHHAAMGLAEQTDALTLVVSEERGRISIFRNGKIQPDKGSDIKPYHHPHLSGEFKGDHHVVLQNHRPPVDSAVGQTMAGCGSDD